MDYTAFAPIFTGSIVPISQTYCLDYRACGFPIHLFIALNHTCTCACTDVDDNTFAGYSNVLNTGEESDPLGVRFLFFMVLHTLCTAWPYTAASNPPVPVNASMVLVTADFDYKCVFTYTKPLRLIFTQ